MIEIVAFSIIAFIGGFLTMWYILDDLGSDVVIFTNDEELQAPRDGRGPLVDADLGSAVGQHR